ncbi:Helix-turn-helix domain-containing protein [Chryseobacterium wanjuense]|uniref:Helix-turn-helix domain-containing protein n=1 Tax=Chryseobacterium wanjuense TaxID=356305 RepID=A0A1I0RZN2_9FLAO|nr:helix-turn-helix domain-containing protein [Chryseobacterium wanjuense]SEW47276.1 Helix-turn-helix domain-containing protein [Chryseobacterium wanjuense]
MKLSFYLQIVIIIICIFFIIKSNRDSRPVQLDIILYFFYYALLHNIYTSIAYYIYYPTEKFFFIEIGAPFGTAYGLLLYYAALKTSDRANININLKIHIIPIIFWFLMFFAFFISGIYEDVPTRKRYNGFLYMYMVLSWLFYIVKLYIFLYKSTVNIKLKSILSTISYILGFTACVFISYLLSVKKYNNDFKRTLIYLAFLFCIIAAIRFYHYKKSILSGKERSKDQNPEENSGDISNEEEDLKYKELVRIMESEKIYLTPKLTVAEMSRITNISPPILAEILAQRNHTFVTFVNSYRINHAIELLSNTDLPIEDIAYRSGFNSRSAFYKQFIKNTTRHPSDYRPAS